MIPSWLRLPWFVRRRPSPAGPPGAAPPLFPPRPPSTVAPIPVVVAAPPVPAADAPFAELQDLAAVSVELSSPGFGGEGRIGRLRLEPECVPPRTSAVIAGTEPFAAEWIVHWHAHRGPEPARDLACSFIPDAVVTGTGEIWSDGRLISDRGVLADYVYRLVLGLPERGEALMAVHRLPLRDVDGPCVVMPGGSAVFGHFLIETMFFVVTVQRMLRGTGTTCRWLVPDTAAAWHRRMLVEELGIPATDLVGYDPRAERVRLRQAIVPALVHRDDGFHPAASGMVDELIRRLPGEPPPAPGPRLFLTRLGLTETGHPRRCLNEATLVEHAVAAHGFTAVAMQTLPWRRQIGLMRQAEIVIGPFGSAMHNAIFAPSGTRVGCIGLGSMVQSEIGALRGHRMAYLTEGFDMLGSHTVDESEFAAFVAALVADA